MELEKEKMELENSQEEIWNWEYNEIIKTWIIPSIVRFIFEEDWKNHYNNNWEKYLDTYTLATTIKYDLIVETGEREYSLTDKGKYILKKYPSENLRVDLRPF